MAQATMTMADCSSDWDEDEGKDEDGTGSCAVRAAWYNTWMLPH